MKPIVLDLETQFILSEVGYDHRKLKISVVGIYDYATDKYEIYHENELSSLFRKIEHASELIGFNIAKFDVPVLAPYYIGNLAKIPVLDMLDHIQKILGMRIALDDLARATLDIKKSGHGLMAINYFREGKWKELSDYCLSDVKITRMLYEYGKENKKVYFHDFRGKREIPVTWGDTKSENQSIDLTLPI